MAEYTYTYENIIIDPSKECIKNIIGKEVYFNNNPSLCLAGANEKSTVSLGVLVEIHKDSITPFVVERNDTDLAYSCIIEKKEEPYSERAKKWCEDNDLKEGDYVKVVRKDENKDDVWRSYWDIKIDETIGKTLRVGLINLTEGRIYLELDDILLEYPYLVLKKVEPEPKYVPFESKEEFIEAFHYHDNANYSETEDILLNYGMWLKDKNSHEIFLVTGVFNQSIHICDFDSDESWGELLNEFTFLDGTPCGKEVKDERE